MTAIDVPTEGRGVSVEIKQRRYIKNITISDQGWDQVLFEGNLGKLVELTIDDCSVLEVRGVNGVLRIDITLEELEEMIARIRSGQASCSKLGSLTSTNISEMI